MCALSLSYSTIWDDGGEERFLLPHCPPLWAPRRKMLSLLMWGGEMGVASCQQPLLANPFWLMRRCFAFFKGHVVLLGAGEGWGGGNV